MKSVLGYFFSGKQYLDIENFDTQGNDFFTPFYFNNFQNVENTVEGMKMEEDLLIDLIEDNPEFIFHVDNPSYRVRVHGQKNRFTVFK